MGQQVAAKTFSREDRQRYRRKVRACLDVFARMLSEARFHPERRSFGLEIELNLTNDIGEPALVNAAALEAIADPNFQTELGQFNVEINVAPRLLEGVVFSELERDARASLNDAEETVATVRPTWQMYLLVEPGTESVIQHSHGWDGGWLPDA